MSREITQLKFFHCLRDWETASKEFLLIGEQFALSDNIWISVFSLCIFVFQFVCFSKKLKVIVISDVQP